MKISRANKNKTKLFRFKLLKTKIYKNQKELNYLLLKDMETRLKKVLHIIYKFHLGNKRILFIGSPNRLNKQLKQLLTTKKHIFLPELVWLNGIVTNGKSSFKYLLKRHAINNDKTSNFLFNLKNQIDLIVVLNESANLTPLKESSLKRIPTISLNSSEELSSLNLVTYKVPGDYNFEQRKARKNFFFLLLNSVIKKAEFIKRRQQEIAQKIKKEKLRAAQDLKEKQLKATEKSERFRLKRQLKNARARRNQKARKQEQAIKNGNSE